jgi:hypothetical protein
MARVVAHVPVFESVSFLASERTHDLKSLLFMEVVFACLTLLAWSCIQQLCSYT